jgi:hypothetical protein
MLYFKAAMESFPMIESEATAEIFWTAFKVLSKAEQQAILRRLIKDQTLRRDLMDLSVIEERSTEPVRSLQEYLEEQQS